MSLNEKRTHLDASRTGCLSVLEAGGGGVCGTNERAAAVLLKTTIPQATNAPTPQRTETSFLNRIDNLRQDTIGVNYTTYVHAKTDAPGVYAAPTTGPYGYYTVADAVHWLFEGTGLVKGDVFGQEDSIVGVEADGTLMDHTQSPPVYTGADGVILWTDSVAMNAWSLALDPAEPQGRSAVSYDAGATWQNHGLGYLSNMRGEYVVRIRLTEGQDPEPPEMIWEDSDHPAVAALREILPTDVTRDASRLERVQRLSSWLASSWEHTSSDRASQYAPWDAATILEWGKSEVGHNGVRPVVMCVQFAVAFVSACQALGIAARCAAVTIGVHSGEGHFVAEAWLPECEKWVLVDPNTDAMFWKGDEPLSLKEVQAHIGDLSGIIRFGGGAAFQRQFSHMAKFMDSALVTGAYYTHRSIWPRADFLSRPDLSPPAHGAQAYCETDLVWEASDLTDGFGMFCAFADPDYFERPPRFS